MAALVSERIELGIGLPAGLSVGLTAVIVGSYVSGAFRLLISQVILRAQGREVPLRMLRFLEDARERHLLRTVGPVYQFRHGRLQERLAKDHPVVAVRS